jgi:hypothetical protein
MHIQYHLPYHFLDNPSVNQSKLKGTNSTIRSNPITKGFINPVPSFMQLGVNRSQKKGTKVTVEGRLYRSGAKY